MTLNRILLVGSPRSGTSWTARALGCAADTRYVNEPDNVDADPTPGAQTGRLGFGPYPILLRGERAPHYVALWRMAFAARLPLRRGRGLAIGRFGLRLPSALRDPLLSVTSRLLAHSPGAARTSVVKSVMAHFALDWIEEEFNPRIVVVQRSPLNVVSSWLDWGVHGFDLHTRPAILECFADPLGVRPPEQGISQTSLAAWWVGLLSSVLAQKVAAHPDWIVVTHDTLCQDAVGGFEALYRKLGLTWTDETWRFLKERGYHRPTFRASYQHYESDPALVTREQPTRWMGRLSERQVTEIQEMLERFPTRGWVRAVDDMTFGVAEPLTPARSEYANGGAHGHPCRH